MNKLIQVTVSGILFQIEESAYEKLRSYLESISAHFRANEGHTEILGDIEARIAELFSGRIAKGYISDSDLDEVIGLMGKPSDMSSEEEQFKESSSGAGSKRLFRDTDEAIAVGVCAGIAAYLNVDPVWVRLGFVLLTFLGGFGVLMYGLLWLIVPAAATASEKLQMRGATINIDSIERKVQEEMSRIQQRLKAYNNSSEGRKLRTRGSQIMEGTVNLSRGIFKALEKGLAFFFIIAALVLLLSFVLGYFNLFNRYSFLPFTKYVSSIYRSSADHILVVTGITLLVGIPLIAIIIKGFLIMTGSRKAPKYISHVLAYSWGLALLIIVVMTVRTAEYFSVDAIKKEKAELPQKDTLFLLADNPQGGDDFQIRANYIGMAINGYHFKSVRPRINIYKASGSLAEIEVQKSASGSNETEARMNASMIGDFWKATDSALYISSFREFEPGTVWRNQQVDIRIKLPVGRVICIDRDMDEMLLFGDGFDYIGDLAGKTCVMTADGLRVLE